MENAVLTSNTSVSESETFVSGVDGTILRDLGGQKQKKREKQHDNNRDQKSKKPGKKKCQKNTKKYKNAKGKIQK